MSIKNIKDGVVARLGSVDNEAFYRLLNNATFWLNTTTDFFGTLAEISLPTEDYLDPQRRLLTLPLEVAAIRAARSSCDRVPFSITPVSGNYLWGSWRNTWQNFNPITFSPLCRSMVPGPLRVLNPVAITGATLTITGQTAQASRVVETIDLSTAGTLSTTNTFTGQVSSITKSVLGSADLVVLDTSGAIVSRIPNTQKSARYLVINLAQYLNAGANENIECLVKLWFPEFNSDYEELPVVGLDYLVEDVICFIFAKERGDSAEAQLLWGIISKRLAELNKNLTGNQTQMISFSPNPHDQIFSGFYGQYPYGYYNKFGAIFGYSY